VAEIESEQRWSVSFAESRDLLAELAAEARTEHSAGTTGPFRQD
jgi:hypothetical protein